MHIVHPTIALLSIAVAIGAATSIQLAVGQPLRIPDFRENPTIGNEPAGPCDDCAVIRSIREVHKRRDGPVYRTSSAGSGAISQPVVGAVIIMMPFGAGSSDAAPVVGGVGTPEIQERLGELSYGVTVRMSDGSLKNFERREGRQYNVGDRVRISEGRWELLAPAN